MNNEHIADENTLINELDVTSEIKNQENESVSDIIESVKEAESPETIPNIATASNNLVPQNDNKIPDDNLESIVQTTTANETNTDVPAIESIESEQTEKFNDSDSSSKANITTEKTLETDITNLTNEISSDTTVADEQQIDITVENTLIDNTVSSENAEAGTEDASVSSSEEQPNKSEKTKHKNERNNFRNPKFDEIFEELLKIKEENGKIEVTVKSRIRGGMRVLYKDMPLFLPASHFSLKRSPSEQEMHDAINSKIQVYIHELQVYEDGRKAVIVSRKQVLIEDFWSKINIGDIVEGRVSSIASFGVFLDLGGIEGLIHISRLSQSHIDVPSSVVKKGELVKAVVIEIDKEKNRIALSRKELEDSPWKNVENDFPVGSQHTGTIKRITEFGIYIELKPNIDGLLRTPEIFWTKRVRKISELFKHGQKILVEILSVSSEKQSISLSHKRTQPNPWYELVDKYPVGTELKGKVEQILPQGVIVSITEDIDGFMPRSKMRNILQGGKIPFHPGDMIDISIADIIPEEESLILIPKVEEPSAQKRETENQKFVKKNSNQVSTENNQNSGNQSAFSLVDLLSDSDKNTLKNSVKE